MFRTSATKTKAVVVAGSGAVAGAGTNLGAVTDAAARQ